jgi:hypothetical protein
MSIEEPTPKEVQLKEIYVSWVDLPATTKLNLTEFEQKEFQLPQMARGYEPVKKLVNIL